MFSAGVFRSLFFPPAPEFLKVRYSPTAYVLNRVCVFTLLLAIAPFVMASELTVWVIDARNGDPVPGVKLVVECGAEEWELRSDEAGRIQMESTAAGAEPPCFVRSEGMLHPLYQHEGSTGAHAGTRLVFLDDLAIVPVWRTGVIDGQVTDGAGRPWGGMAMYVAKRSDEDGTMHEFPLPQTVMTDDRGRYRISGLPPGSYAIGAFVRGPVTSSAAAGATYYGDTQTLGEASELQVVGDGELRGINIHVSAREMASLSVSLSDNSDTVRGLPSMVWLVEQGGVRVPIAGGVFDQDGICNFDRVPAGNYEVFGFFGGSTDELDSSSKDATRFGYETVQLQPRELTTVSLRVQEPATISAKVLVHARDAARCGSVERLAMWPVSTWPEGLSFGAMLRDGQFTLKNILPAAYRVYADASGGDCEVVEAVPEGQTPGTAGAPGRTDVVEVTASANITVTIGVGVGAISGRVQNADGRAVGTRVRLIAENGAVTTRIVETDESGMFSFQGLPTGRYLVMAGSFKGSRPVEGLLGVRIGRGQQATVMLSTSGEQP